MELINQYLIFLDLSVLALLIIFMLRGFIIGTKKMLITSVLKWGLILVLILFSGNIADALLETIKIKGVPVNEYLIELLTKELELTIEKGSYLETLIYALIKAVASLVIGYASIFLVSFIIYPIIALILTILGIRKFASSNKTFLSRAVGMAIGLVVTCIIFVTCYMPIYGSLTLATSIEEDITMINNATPAPEEKNLSTDENNKNSSIIMSCLTEEYNVCEQYIDNFFVVSMNGSNVKIINEYRNFRQIIPVVTKIMQDSENVTITEDEFNTIINAITNTELKEIAIPVTLEVLYAKGTFEKNNIDISKEDIYDTNWELEIEYLNDFLNSLTETYKLFNKYQDNLKNVFGDETFTQTIINNFKQLFKITIINKYGPDILNKILENATADIEDPNTLKALELIKFQDNLLQDIENVCNGLQNIYYLGFINKDIKPNYNDEAIKQNVKNLADNIFNLSFVKENEENLIEFLYEMLELNKYAEFKKTDLDKIDWESEPTNIANIFIEFTLLLGDTNIKDADVMMIFNENNETLINAIASSDVIRYAILPGLNGMIKEELKNTKFEDIAELINIPTEKETLKNDLTIFTKIIPLFQNETTDVLEDEQKLQSLLTDLLSLSFIKNKEDQLFDKLIDSFGLNDFIDSYGIVLDYNVDDWTKEGNTLASIAYYANNLGTSNLDDITSLISDKKTELKQLLILISKSQLIQKSLPEIIDKSLTDLDLASWKSEWLENEKTNFHQEMWEDEIDNILEILDMYQKTNIDFDNIQNDNITNVKNILEKMTELKSIKMDYLVEIINNKLKEETSTNKNYLIVPDDMNWKQEINSLFGENGIYQSILEIDSTTTYRQYGQIIDKLKNLQMLKDSYYTFITDYIMNLSDYKNGNVNIDLDQEVLKKVTSFEEELAIIDEIDFTQDIQNGEIIDKLMTSVLLRSQTEKYIKDIIIENELDKYYDVNTNLSSDIDSVNEKIKLSKEDTDPSNDWSWAKEIEIIENFKIKLDDTITAPTKEKALDLKAIAQKGVITTKALERVIETYPILGTLLSL